MSICVNLFVCVSVCKAIVCMFFYVCVCIYSPTNPPPLHRQSIHTYLHTRTHAHTYIHTHTHTNPPKGPTTRCRRSCGRRRRGLWRPVTRHIIRFWTRRQRKYTSFLCVHSMCGWGLIDTTLGISSQSHAWSCSIIHPTLSSIPLPYNHHTY